MPKISIITPCRNAAAFIEDAIRSVLAQGCSDIEHIVVDGGSTDGTLAIISRYPHLKVIRQNDRNMYEAVNRGIDVATGDLIGHLNADDCYVSGAFDRVLAALHESPDAEMFSGSVYVSDVEGKGCDNGDAYAPVSLNIVSLTFGIPAINGRFMTRKLYQRIGMYDSSYRRAADREFLLRAAVNCISNVKVSVPLYHYRSHAGSLTIGGHWRDYLSVGYEHMAIALQYIADQRLNKKEKAILMRWHSDAATLAIADALLCRNITHALSIFLQATKVDWLAPIRIPVIGIEKLVRLRRRAH